VLGEVRNDLVNSPTIVCVLKNAESW
jgi:hypothetical protein